MEFESDFARVPENAYCFLFCDDEIVIKEVDGGDKIPFVYELKTLNNKPTQGYYIGMVDGNRFYAAVGDKSSLKGFSFKKVRQVYGQIENSRYWLMLRAFHIISWMKLNRFCGCCGGSMKVFPNELAVQCVACERIVYPRISPAIIVAVIKDDKILLARSNRFPPGRYSVLAGFVEPGETLEDCVKRELKEEVGIGVTDIQYFGSQPWPFPDSLMVAFTARWSEGEISIDNNEIVDANWYSADNLPNLPGRDSIARRLIDWFVEHAKI
ncbi:nudix hydrolase [Lucifera butyrica]|uniref:NAD(+) diphosphatase n=1 Tax=Lucifera butyrica TaxID=1351585 RepID=A0A498RFD5_9FIRM|nr:NAD(+) diphosphatase [Lucifera butyrica]VBB08812.1 nudix hydrolase [Lucifera butyrica]